MRIRRQSEGHGELINISSLIDVMFILIIFFLATTTFQQEERDIEVALPDAAGEQSLSEAPRLIVINVREDGSYLLGDKPMGLDELREAVIAARRENADQSVLVRGDRRALHGHVAAAIQTCKAAGIHKAKIAYELPN
jgi:biopolymer transport protein ExbD